MRESMQGLRETNILYEDDALLVCRKQAGVPVQTQAAGKPDMVSLLKNYRARKGEEPYIGLVHRLDQPVEGLIVFAKTKRAAASLAEQIAAHTAGKQYYAVVWGTPKTQEGTYVDWMLRDPKTNTSKVVRPETPGARRAELSFRTLEKNEEKSLLLICLKTGRHHQIRVQLSHAGHPIYGDSKYGARREAFYLPLALCACRLSFLHPYTGKKMDFSIRPEGAAFAEFFHEENG